MKLVNLIAFIVIVLAARTFLLCYILVVLTENLFKNFHIFHPFGFLIIKE